MSPSFKPPPPRAGDARGYTAAAAVVWVLILAVHGTPGAARCDFRAVFNFGDSNSETGGFWAAFPAQPSPFGMTYFGRPSGRASDGRAVVDFLGTPSTDSYFGGSSICSIKTV